MSNIESLNRERERVLESIQEQEEAVKIIQARIENDRRRLSEIDQKIARQRSRAPAEAAARAPQGSSVRTARTDAHSGAVTITVSQSRGSSSRAPQREPRAPRASRHTPARAPVVPVPVPAPAPAPAPAAADDDDDDEEDPFEAIKKMKLQMQAQQAQQQAQQPQPQQQQQQRRQQQPQRQQRQPRRAPESKSRSTARDDGAMTDKAVDDWCDESEPADIPDVRVLIFFPSSSFSLHHSVCVSTG